MVTEIIIFISGCFAGYMTSYIKKKGENRALLEDIETIEEIKQKTESKYNVKIEDLKKEHQLEIQQRKSHFDEKLSAYNDFCSELDKYHGKGQEILKDKALPMISKFLTSLNSSEPGSLPESFNNYFHDMTLLCNDINLAYSELKNSSNKLRLIVSNEIELILNDLLDNLSQNKDVSNNFIQYLATPDGMIDVKSQNEISNKLIEIDKANQTLRDQLIKQMRLELHQI
ncbi:hypothetical protein [uncultured Tolumonas sp.]|uniref:hypothetical protein n=1 Tax=uncultured Tolumonas sp. TaxID=263765 RepID=UPI002A0A9902|nr:hypothetical protein [uncultured Tolumonas sp.]